MQHNWTGTVLRPGSAWCTACGVTRTWRNAFEECHLIIERPVDTSPAVEFAQEMREEICEAFAVPPELVMDSPAKVEPAEPKEEEPSVTTKATPPKRQASRQRGKKPSKPGKSVKSSPPKHPDAKRRTSKPSRKPKRA